MSVEIFPNHHEKSLRWQKNIENNMNVSYQQAPSENGFAWKRLDSWTMREKHNVERVYVGHPNTTLSAIQRYVRDKTFHLVWFSANQPSTTTTHQLNNKLTYWKWFRVDCMALI